MSDLRNLEALVAEYAALIAEVRGVLGLTKASCEAPLPDTPPASATPPAPQAKAGEEHIFCRRPRGTEVQLWSVPAWGQCVTLHLSPSPASEGLGAPSEPLLIWIETLSAAQARAAVQSRGRP